ncbi:MAG: sulfatase, partial [Bacteroidota bacterium]|nr:sulfatase [Bacteroidota bacterium]
MRIFVPQILITFSLFLLILECNGQKIERKPNVLILHADEWRAQATGYSGDKNVKTPNLDKLAATSANFTLAVSG